MMSDADDEKPLVETASATFEDALARLQEIVRELESGEQTLDDSLALYEQGVSALRVCHGLLDRAEQRIQKLISAPGGSVLEEPFDPNANARVSSDSLPGSDAKVKKRGAVRSKRSRQAGSVNSDGGEESPLFGA